MRAASSIQSGLDPATLGALFDRHGAIAWTLALRMTGDDASARDVVEQAFLALMRRPLPSHDDQVRLWLLALVVRLATGIAGAAPRTAPDPEPHSELSGSLVPNLAGET